VIIKPLEQRDRGYALFSWREGVKKAPGLCRLPWAYFKDTLGYALAKILDDPTTRLLGAYTVPADKLVGWLAMTPGKRVATVHWVHVKHEERRAGVMTALLDAADLGKSFVYTLRGRRDRAKLPDGSTSKSLDETLVAALRARGVNTTFVNLKEWLA
jgi:hypothetical protein